MEDFQFDSFEKDFNLLKEIFGSGKTPNCVKPGNWFKWESRKKKPHDKYLFGQVKHKYTHWRLALSVDGLTETKNFDLFPPLKKHKPFYEALKNGDMSEFKKACVLYFDEIGQSLVESEFTQPIIAWHQNFIAPLKECVAKGEKLQILNSKKLL